MANTMSTAAMALALVLLASGSALARPVTSEFQAVAQRALRFEPPACRNCIDSGLQCALSSVQCLPGTKVDIYSAAGCRQWITDIIPLTATAGAPPCTPPSQYEVACPNHGGITQAQVCAKGISLVGAQCQDTCVSVNVVAMCDLNGQSARSKATCANPVVDCQEGEIVDISKFSCSSTNIFAPDTSKDTLYFPLNKDLSLTASKVKCPPAGKSCQYQVGALSSNGCKAVNVDQMATVTVGRGPVDYSGACEKPF